MNTDRVNYLNIGLMLSSALAAFILPFEVFLLAYAVLGPLHYLTEISWLHDRGYFLKGRWDGLPLMLLCLALLLASLSHWPGDRKNEFTVLVNYTAFGGAAVLLITRSVAIRTIAFALIMLSFLGAQHSESLRVFFGVFLPTVIHVFIFTGAFVALGALRGRSKPAAASLAIFGLCAMSFFLYAPMLGHAVSSRVREAYQPFEPLNLMMFRALHLSEAGSRDAVYQSAAGLAIMRFIAFAYLYHYLNWFSKTSVIKWNRIAPARALGIVVLWTASLWMYANDSRTGLLILMTLSFLHGILELPLDHRTFLELGRELLARYSQPGDARGTIEAMPDTFYRPWQQRVPPYPD